MSEWNIESHDSERVAGIAGEFKISEVCAKLLLNRGYNADGEVQIRETRAFLDKSRDILHDPFLMSDMDKGIDRLQKALINKEKVMVYGDYDVDGISSVCVMYIYLEGIGLDVCYYIPDRFEEGYGINKNAVDRAGEKNIDLIITVDTGITAEEETRYAKELGIDIIITDHHECHNRLPRAEAVINPKKPGCNYPFKELAGVGVAFKFITAHNIKYGEDNIIDFEGFCEFVAMGTVADIMSLTGENRVMTDSGLKKMRVSKNFGVNAILEGYFKYKGKTRVSTDIIGFYISPRINAAGRLAKADKAVELFLSKTRSAAEIIAEELSVLNRRRQETEKEIMALAENQLEDIEDRAQKTVIILRGEDWNQGVIGIVASKLSEKYNKAFILFAKDANGEYKGSCRSVKNINITEMLSQCSDILLKYGGHERAAGLSAEYKNIEELDKRLNAYARENNIKTTDDKIYDIECGVSAGNITCDTVRELEILEPFGNGNKVPLFALTGCRILNITHIGENKHIKIELEQNGFSFEAIYFNMDAAGFEFDKSDIIDIACNIGINEFMNREKVQYIIRGARLNEEYGREYLSEKENYYKFINNNSGVRILKGDVPDREDFKSVYIFLVNSFKKDISYDFEYNYNINKMQTKYIESLSGLNKKFSRFKFRVILDIFCETGIINIEHDFCDINRIKINGYYNNRNKIDLDSSNLYKKLKNLR
ncbi:MAG: single-stranded-DNA-specific exonuclease RecJ [Oscillospiraceae bacterium]|nr:single-stranded-DNA-specific exonuclease RecJ [Oscillospiraceae bacterium]